MTTAKEIRDLAEAARPAIRASLDAAEELAAIRDAATAKGVDWSQLKSLLKAQEQDTREESGDGKRVERIIEKADYASAYADMLGLRKDEREKQKVVHLPTSTAVERPRPIRPIAAEVTQPASSNDGIPEMPAELRIGDPANAWLRSPKAAAE